MSFLFSSAVVAATYLCLLLATRLKRKSFKVLLHILFIILSLALMAHFFPWFQNMKVIDGAKFSSDSLPFTMYLNKDKPFIAIIIFATWGLGNRPFNLKKIFKSASVSLVFCVLTLMPAALATGFIRFDPKLPNEALIWAFNNLVLVCAAEEAFFRRYLQDGISSIIKGSRFSVIIAIFVSSILFGLVHFQGGATYVALSTVAGLFYGYAFHKTGRVEAAILTHFGLNLIHFVFFSYPALG